MSKRKHLHRTAPPFRAIVLYYHRRRISAEALESLDRYIRQGGGCLAIHSASASSKTEGRYFDILGGRFSRHGPISDFTVRPVDPGSIFSPDKPFSLYDEAYVHDINPTKVDQNAIHYAAEIHGRREPLVWTRQHGAGQVCYYAAGHTTASLRHPAIRIILEEGLLWAAGCEPSLG